MCVLDQLIISPSKEKFIKRLTKVLSVIPDLLSEHMLQNEDLVDVSTINEQSQESHHLLPSNQDSSTGSVQ